MIGGTEHNNRDGLEFIIIPPPCEDVEAAEARHFQVQEDDSRQGKFLAIRKASNTFKIFYGFVSIRYSLNAAIDARLAAGVLEQEYIIRIIFDMKNRRLAHDRLNLYSGFSCGSVLRKC